jgi:hypothetical protein
MTKQVIHTLIVGASGRGKSYTIKNEFLKPIILNNKENKYKIKCLILDLEKEFNYKGVKTTTEKDYLNDLNKYKVCRIIPAPARQIMEEKEKKEYYKKLYGDLFYNLRNVVLIIDEVQAQGGSEHRLNPGLAYLINQGRKRGIKLIVAGQRMALISNTLIGQCRYAILKGQNQKADWDRYKKEYPAEAVQYLREQQEKGNIYATVHILDGRIIKRC